VIGDLDDTHRRTQPRKHVRKLEGDDAATDYDQASGWLLMAEHLDVRQCMLDSGNREPRWMRARGD
jgi:hypothetical protein